MQHPERNLMRAVAVPALTALVLGGCSGTWEKLSDATSASNFTRDFTNIDWNPYSKASSGTVVARLTADPATAADFVNPDGSCAAAQTQKADDATASTGAPSGAPVGLQMTECAVVRSLGAPERVDLGANERGERKATLLYSRGDRPGLYVFTAGRLTAIERVEPPEPPKPQKKAPAKPAPKRAT